MKVLSHRPRIELLRVGTAPLDDAILRDLAFSLGRTLGLQTRIEGPLELLPSDVGGARVGDLTADADRDAEKTVDGRASSDKLLDVLIEHFDVEGKSPTRWILGVTGHDLFAPDKPCVFGEATLGGHWAIVGVARFGVPAVASPRLLERLLKESLHEVGHLAGLPHCGDPDCPLARASTVAEIDRKETDFCGDCRRRFDGRMGP